jgi:predicted dehydrogenase
MKICLVGEGAFANKHIDAIARIEDVEVSVICGGVAETTEAVANARGIPFYTTDLAEALNQPRSRCCDFGYTHGAACRSGYPGNALWQACAD